MAQKARIRFQFVENKPRILAVEPYYTLFTVVQTAAGALGAFASTIGGMSAMVGEGIISPLLGTTVVLFLVFLGGELLLVRANPPTSEVRSPQGVRPTVRSVVERKVTDSVSRIMGMNVPSEIEISTLLCRNGRHAYHPQGITTKDRLGISFRPQPPRMVWRCARCGEEQWLTPGISPE